MINNYKTTAINMSGPVPKKDYLPTIMFMILKFTKTLPFQFFPTNFETAIFTPMFIDSMNDEVL